MNQRENYELTRLAQARIMKSDSAHQSRRVVPPLATEAPLGRGFFVADPGGL